MTLNILKAWARYTQALQVFLELDTLLQNTDDDPVLEERTAQASVLAFRLMEELQVLITPRSLQEFLAEYAGVADSYPH